MLVYPEMVVMNVC